MLERVWKKGNPPILLVGMSIGVATMENSMHEGSLFSTSLATLVICCHFENNHSDMCEVISHCGFDLHFPDDY